MAADPPITTIIERMVHCGVNFLAVDFDDTLINGHTFGKWDGTPESLGYKVRPFFKRLIPEVLNAGLHVAIVTFSPQTKLIHSVLQHVFPDHARRILVRGRDLSWDYQGNGSVEGKQKHMASAAEELNSTMEKQPGKTKALPVTRSTTVLIDDDVNNICIALKNRVRAILCHTGSVDQLEADLLALK